MDGAGLGKSQESGFRPVGPEMLPRHPRGGVENELGSRSLSGGERSGLEFLAETQSLSRDGQQGLSLGALGRGGGASGTGEPGCCGSNERKTERPPLGLAAWRLGPPGGLKNGPPRCQVLIPRTN